MRQALLASVTLIGILAVKPVMAAMSEDAMMQQLKSMQAQMERMQKEMTDLKTELAKTKSQAAASEKKAEEVKTAVAAKGITPSGKDVKVSLSPGPKFETADGDYSFRVGGFAQLDAGIFKDDKRDHPDGTSARRARVNVSGVIAKDFQYKIENDFAGNMSALTDVFIQYVGFSPVSIIIGQFKEPFSLETLTSDLFVTFIERASSTVFSPDRNIGIAVSSHGDSPLGMWTAMIGGFGSGTGTASTDDEARDVTARLTIAPVAEETRVLHLGVAGSHRIPLSLTDTMTFASKPETSLPSSVVSTGAITMIDSVDLLGLEAAGVYGPFGLQGEYVVADVNRYGGMIDQRFDSYYVEASYFLTGESKNYSASSGKFDRVKPKNPFNIKNGQWGAWQAAARLSDLDLNDSVIKGGEMRDITLGLRWIPHPNVSFSANYIMVDTDAFAVVADDDPDVWMFRSQFDF